MRRNGAAVRLGQPVREPPDQKALLPQILQQFEEIRRRFGHQFPLIPFDGMAENQPVRMERLSPDKALLIRFGLLAGSSRQPSQSVHRVAQDGMPDVVHVHPDLVRPSRFQRYAQKRCVSQHLPNRVVSHRTTPALHDRHGRPVGRMASDGSVYRPLSLRGDAPDDGQIVPMNPARLEIGG